MGSLIQPDGKILISGRFTSFNGVNKKIVRLNIDGSIDTSFNLDSGVSVGSLDDYKFNILDNGKIIITSSINNANYNYTGLVRLNSDGSLDSSYNVVAGSGTGNNTYSHITQPDGKVIIVGHFTSYNGVSRTYVARIGVNDLNLSQYDRKKIAVYPNPATAILNLQNPNNLSLDKITITDLTGKVILTQTTNTTQVNVEKLACGLYVIEAVSGQEKFTSKFVKE